MQQAKSIGAALLLICTSTLGHGVKTYELENGTVNVYSCDSPTIHEAEMPERKILWEIREVSGDAGKFVVYGTFSSSIQDVPFYILHAETTSGDFFQFPVLTSPDFSTSTDFVADSGSFSLVTDRTGLKKIVLKFQYKTTEKCADDVFIYSAKPKSRDT